MEGSQSFLLFAAASPQLRDGLGHRPQEDLDNAEISHWSLSGINLDALMAGEPR